MKLKVVAGETCGPAAPVIALALKLPAEGSPVSGSFRVLTVDITPERMDDAVGALRGLIGRLAGDPGVLPLIDVSVADGRLVVGTPTVTGDQLNDALKLYGPARVDDALPRVRQLAGTLDLAASEGLGHGALHPHDIIVSADDTQVAGLGVATALARIGVFVPLDPRYTAPEVLASHVGTPAGDQFALAVIAHEWMFGGATTPADGFLAVPVITGINAALMQRAFDTATAADPAARFSSCLEFCAALERSAGVANAELPLRGDAGFAAGAGSLFSATPPPSSARQFGLPALVATLAVGVAIGAVAMRLLGWPSAAQSIDDASQDFTDAPMAPLPAPSLSPTKVVDTAAPPAVRPDAARAAGTDAGLLIHSTPAGASVTIDGVEHGPTPIAVRGLELGTRRVGVSRPGYQSAERQVTLTAERPSRTLDVDLVAVARVAPRVASPPAGATTGSLLVDSRPAGAVVTIDGRPSGSTPVTLTAVAPGRHTVRIERPGYRTVTTTVEVKAGARARVAARLEGGSDEE